MSGSLWDFLTPTQPFQTQPELDVFLEGGAGSYASGIQAGGTEADLSHLFSVDFPEFLREFDGTG